MSDEDSVVGHANNVLLVFFDLWVEGVEKRNERFASRYFFARIDPP